MKPLIAGCGIERTKRNGRQRARCSGCKRTFGHEV